MNENIKLSDVYACLFKKSGIIDTLKDIPNFDFLDMSIIFMGKIAENAYVTITNDSMKLLGWSKGDVLINGLKNAKAMYHVSMIEEELIRTADDSITPEMEDFIKTPMEVPMCVIKTTNGWFGAIQMLNNTAMDEAVTMLYGDGNIGNLVILPSSVHEILAIPEGLLSLTDDMKQYINYTIRSINADMVYTEEILSDHAYIWDCHDRVIREMER